ncbi:MAG TPA: TonB family protein, partial [Caulobacteraceae bacterium]|nr:TonB family protein [Caulobacteraceae bacterium]
LEALAAAAVAAAPADAAAPAASNGSTTVSPLTVTPEPKTPPATTINIPYDDSATGEFAIIWPTHAFQARISGHVVLSCDIDRYGLAEWCKVASEHPSGEGFGAAALELRPTFKIKPAMGPDGPVDQVMNIAVEFQAPDANIDWGSARGGGSEGESGGGRSGVGANPPTIFGGPPLAGKAVSILNNPIWLSTVSYDEVAQAYPTKGGGVDGYAVAHCEVTRRGALINCEPIKEDPNKRGFGKAAVRLASKFRVAPEWSSAPNHADLWVDVPFRFPAPGGAENRVVTNPYWVSGFNPEQELKLYPPEAAAQGVASGYGVAKCVVAVDGTLTDCSPQTGDPDGLGFSEAAVKLASTMRMNPWTGDGAPVDGAVVRIGVRLNLKSQ